MRDWLLLRYILWRHKRLIRHMQGRSLISRMRRAYWRLMRAIQAN